jgi:hypothetical protein
MHYKCNRSGLPPYPLLPWSWRRCVPLGIRPPEYSATLDLVCLCIECWCCTVVVTSTFYLKYGDFLKAPCLYFVKFSVYKISARFVVTFNRNGFCSLFRYCGLTITESKGVALVHCSSWQCHEGTLLYVARDFCVQRETGISWSV